MIMDAAKLSSIIRAKKKKLLEAEPELVGTSPVPDMNAQDVYDKEQQGRIESTLDVPHKINADDKLGTGYEGVGLSPEEKSRMPRLRAYLNSLDMGM